MGTLVLLAGLSTVPPSPIHAELNLTTTAWIMGGTFRPTPSQHIVDHIDAVFVKTLYPAAEYTTLPLTTPEALSDASYVAGVSALAAELAPGDLAFGMSQSAGIIGMLLAGEGPLPSGTSFILLAPPDLDIPGIAVGLFEQPGLDIDKLFPQAAVPFVGLDSDRRVDVYYGAYDPSADAPEHWNWPAFINWMTAWGITHAYNVGNHQLTPADIQDAQLMDRMGDTSVYMFPLSDAHPLPMLAWLAGTPFYELLGPVAQVEINVAYENLAHDMPVDNFLTNAGIDTTDMTYANIMAAVQDAWQNGWNNFMAAWDGQ